MVNAEELLSQSESSVLLTKAEIEGIILMREEEKLARDVYTTLGEKWNLNIFSNIAQSEQTHMDAVLYLVQKYEIEDPVKNDTVGVFTDPALQNLYNQLVSKGEESMIGALVVGANIEDLDIYDLERLMSQTDNQDILITYANLQKGSRNHMRAFNKQIEKNGGKYSPQYISINSFESIVSSEQERGAIK
ncbi:DUF2202 domain-containing protein [Candidatus Nomurabacteria bacterium]|nr:DUF2202 domain-containing protein [Candidatus Nomurabacteria bacterium]